MTDSLFSNDVAKEILAVMVERKCPASVAGPYVGIPKAAVARWVRYGRRGNPRYADFAAEVERVEAMRDASVAADLWEVTERAMERQKEISPDEMAKGEHAANLLHIRWMAERRMPEEYAPVSRVKVSFDTELTRLLEQCENLMSEPAFEELIDALTTIHGNVEGFEPDAINGQAMEDAATGDE